MTNQTDDACVRTRTVNVKTEEFDVYMGRAMPGFSASKYANPFKIGPDGTRKDVLDKHRAWLPEQAELMEGLGALRGLRLGCWCKPMTCHVDFIVELLEGPLAPELPAQGQLF